MSDSSNVVAIANYTNFQLETGWMYLEVRTNPEFEDETQALAAGMLEGYLTRTSITEYYKVI